MPRYLVFLDGVPDFIGREAVVSRVAAEDCYSSRDFFVLSSPLGADKLLDAILGDVERRMGKVEKVAALVVPLEGAVATEAFRAVEDCY